MSPPSPALAHAAHIPPFPSGENLHTSRSIPTHSPTRAFFPTAYAVAGLTTASLIIAGAKLRRRDSTSLNHWLRVRVVMQGLTVVAVVGGSWWYGQMKHQKDAAAAVEQERLLERAAFEARLREAEETDRLERLEAEVFAKQAQGASGSAGWLGGWWGKGKGNGSGEASSSA